SPARCAGSPGLVVGALPQRVARGPQVAQPLLLEGQGPRVCVGPPPTLVARAPAGPCGAGALVVLRREVVSALPQRVARGPHRLEVVSALPQRVARGPHRLEVVGAPPQRVARGPLLA